MGQHKNLCVRVCFCCLMCLVMTATEDRETEDAGRAESTPAAEDNVVAHCVGHVRQDLQRGQPDAGAAAGLCQVHLARLPLRLFDPPPRQRPLWASTVTTGPGFIVNLCFRPCCG